MVERNSNIAKLKASYLFPEIARRKQELLNRHPEANVISLGVGDTTEPIPEYIAKRMASFASGLSTKEGYHGYGPEQGFPKLREAIASVLYNDMISPDEIFINDGAKCDIGRLQLFFGPNVKIAVQDPSYPAFVDSCVIAGQSKAFNPESGRYEGITYLPCNFDNDFFPDISLARECDVLYVCSPNNPTGTVFSQAQCEALVQWAKQHRVIILFDSAYAAYIQDPSLPTSLYPIKDARSVAIEMGSFSKLAGFTGIRLGWTVVPKELQYNNGFSIHADWKRLFSTIFNGASNIAQSGGIACLEEKGLQLIKHTISFYLENTQILRRAVMKLGLACVGGDNAPYIWVYFGKYDSWDIFQMLLERCHIVCSPGSGFGPSGQGFIRFSAFGQRNAIEEAASRLSIADLR